LVKTFILKERILRVLRSNTKNLSRHSDGCKSLREIIWKDQGNRKRIRRLRIPNYKVAAGKALDEVEEIIIFVEKNHTNVPGVKVIAYKIPASDGKFTQRINGVDVNKGYTTGNLIGDGPDNYVKTIYDPKIWTDAKLEKALKEALQDVVNKNKGVIPREWEGLSNEGYPIHGYFDNGKVTSFFFK
jgi:hypothetical protein